ncbi:MULTISPECIES: VasL domain-containing protein [unclassified Cedecea]|uniref:VasL domain-containing protein n=1 Tax=unclassified Cedecea TaxID=2649846 RepID=UPI00301965A4
MSEPIHSEHTRTLKINSHDPRGHHTFLQFSNDMHRWKIYSDDGNWWREREKDCNQLFQKFGYDLQIGMWYCLIACQRNGWKGVASATQVFTSGFAKQHPPCWPPLSALDLRRQMIDSYCRYLTPLIYCLPLQTDNIPAMEQLLMSSGMLEAQAVELQSSQGDVFRQLSLWLEMNIKMLQQQTQQSKPAVPAAPKLEPTITHLQLRESRPLTWPNKLCWSAAGAAFALSILSLYQSADNPDVLRVTNSIWQDNPLVTQWKNKQEIASKSAPANTTYEELISQLTAIEKRLLEAEQKRTSYMTISELKTAIYQLRETVHRQSTMVENQLNQIQRLKDNDRQIPPAQLYALSAKIEGLKSKFLLLKMEDGI